jgi:hypothetical protein
VARTRESEVGARFFGEVLQGKVERVERFERGVEDMREVEDNLAKAGRATAA